MLSSLVPDNLKAHLGAGDALGLLSSYSSDTPRSQDADEIPDIEPSQPIFPQSSAPPKTDSISEGRIDSLEAQPAAKTLDESAQLPAETAAVMEKLLAFVKVGFLAQWCRLLAPLPLRLHP